MGEADALLSEVHKQPRTALSGHCLTAIGGARTVCRSSLLGARTGMRVERPLGTFTHGQVIGYCGHPPHTAHRLRPMTGSPRIISPGSTVHLASSIFGAVKKSSDGSAPRTKRNNRQARHLQSHEPS